MTFNLTLLGAARDLARGFVEIGLIIGEHVVMNDQFWGVFCESMAER